MSSIPNRQYNILCDLVREGPALTRKPSGHRHELRPSDSAADAACMRRLAEEDIASFELLYARHATPMYSLAFRMLFHRQPDASDVVYEVFEALWRGRRAEQHAVELAAWLLMQTRERALYRLRVLRITVPAQAMCADQVSSTATPDGPRLSSARGQDRVSEVLRSLPAPDRDAIEMTYFDGATRQEVAARLRQPLAAVNRVLQQTLATVRAALRGEVR